jgi:hypothetical protein
MKVSFALSIAGAVVVLYRVRTRLVSRAIPLDVDLATSVAIYRLELVRRRDLLRAVARWYLFPILPGMVVFTLGLFLSRPAAGVRMLALFVFVGFLTQALNQRAARRIDQKIARLATLEHQ